MEWLEIVRVRSETQDGDSLADTLGRFFANADEEGLKGRQICVSAEGRDVMVLLAWGNGFAELGRSRMGCLAASEMSRFGMVDHSVWKLWGTGRGWDSKTGG